MDFPAKMAVPAEPPPDLLRGLGSDGAQFVGKNAFDYLVEIESEDVLRKLSPDHSALGKLPVRGVIVTAPAAGGDYDFVSRFFAPGSGDRRGSGDGVGAYRAGAVLGRAAGEDRIDGISGVGAGRCGACQFKGDRVLLGGQAVTVMTGELLA